MSRRRKNMLEAFRASAIEGHTPRVPSQEVSAGGPFAPKKRDAAPPRVRKEKDGERPDALAVLRRGAPLFVGVAMLIGVAFWVGKLSSEPVEAGDREVAERPPNRMLPRDPVQGAGAGRPDGGSGAGAGGSGSGARPGSTPSTATGAGAAAAETGSGGSGTSEGTLDDERFLDPANLYTIRVIEYRRDERGMSLAKACYEYLRRQGLPAIWPVEQGNSLILYVGASSVLSELDSLTRYIADLPGPPPLSRPREFEGAYRVNIDDVIYR